jgi:hypothetical protein
MGVLTLDSTKHAMCGIMNSMLRERRLHISKTLVSRDPKEALTRLREQLEVYSYQFKTAETPFQKDQMCLGGKVGGLKDDVAIALQLVTYWSGVEVVPQ